MQTPLQITFHNMTPSDSLSEWIRHKTEKLEQVYPRLVGCSVAVEEPNHHHRQGKGRHFRVRVELTVPGERLVAGREGPDIASHEDAYLAVTKAFEAARRQLDAFVHRIEGRTKAHQPPKKRSRPWLRS
jgi:ribosome-associated translation inhibitor RaiA